MSRFLGIGVLLWAAVARGEGIPSPPRVDAACRDRKARATELSNEGDRLIRVDVDAAIVKYLAARDVHPTEPRIVWKLAVAYERRQDWLHTVEALTGAVELAPNVASYWHRLGHALVKLAEEGDPQAYERAKPALEQCIQRDPNIAECHYLLAESTLWTDDEQRALVEYSRAIERDPKQGYFYPSLAELYLTLGMPGQAEAVLVEATHQVESNERHRNALRASYTLLAQIALQRGDTSAQVAALEQAEPYADEEHPEFSFELGATYATMNPPDKPRAIRLLQQFSKRACRGDVPKLKEQCEIARVLLVRLGAP